MSVEQLAVAFNAASLRFPPLRHAALSGVGCGFQLSLSDWAVLLHGEGSPFNPYAFIDPEKHGELYPSLRCCWLSDSPASELTGALRQFDELAAAADEMTQTGDGRSTGLPESWLAKLHVLADRHGLPPFRSHRYRFLRQPQDPKTLVRTEVSRPPVWGRQFPEMQWPADQSDAFPHRHLSILSPDAFQVSAWALSTSIAANGLDNPTPADTFSDLLEFAQTDLKGIEQTVLETLCRHGGRIAIVDLAAHKTLLWGKDWITPWRGVQVRLNPKLAKRSPAFVLSRINNFAVLEPVSPSDQGAN
jgi:hypothetical protein